MLGEKRFAEARAKYDAARKAKKGKAAKGAPALDLEKTRQELSDKLRRPATEDDLYSHLMYPQVFADFTKHQQSYGDVDVLPTPAFFYGLKVGEEISVSIEEGKILIVRLVSVGVPDKDGRRTVSYELNGIMREAFIVDKGVAPKTKARPKADLADPAQVAAPIPGLVATLSVSVGSKVAKGDKLLMMEAMKMQTTVYAPCDGVVAELHVTVGETVESKDLLIKLRAAG